MGVDLPSARGRLRAYIERCIRIDTRTLAVFRIFAGLLVVADLLLRSRNFTYFYTDEGVVPRELVLDSVSTPTVSVYHLTTDSTVIAALFVLQGLIALALIVGYRTRIATVLTFLLVVSLDHHNPFVLSYADVLFRLLLFWAIFLPLGERWSVDAVHADRQPRPYVANAATALALGQMVYMYVTNGLIKTQSELWPAGEAAPLVFGLDEMTFLLGEVMREFSTLLAAGGLLWYYMLLSAPLLIFLRGHARMALVGLFVGGHLAFALTVRIGAFPYVALLGVLLFLQGAFWRDANRIFARLGADPATIRRRLTPLETLAVGIPSPRIDAPWADRTRRYAHAAGIRIVLVTIAVVAVVMAANVALAVADDTGEPVEQRVDSAVVETLESTPGVREVDTVASALGIDQPIGWGVFAGPEPRTTDRYYVFPAETADGDLVDVYNDRPLSFERPHESLQRQHDTYRERFYMNSVHRGGTPDGVAGYLAEYICKRGTADGDEIVALSMYVVEEEVTHDTVDRPEDRERTFEEFYRHGCGDEGPRPIGEPPA